MIERLKRLRKELNLTQAEFAARIGIKRGAVGNYEIGRNIPTDSVVALICREFNVNEQWLRTGEGEMFSPAPSTALDALALERGLTPGERILVEKLLALSPEVRKGIISYIVDVAAAISAGDAQTQRPPDPAEMTAEELHAELDRQLEREKEAEAGSAVS